MDRYERGINICEGGRDWGAEMNEICVWKEGRELGKWKRGGMMMGSEV